MKWEQLFIVQIITCDYFICNINLQLKEGIRIIYRRPQKWAPRKLKLRENAYFMWKLISYNLPKMIVTRTRKGEWWGCTPAPGSFVYNAYIKTGWVRLYIWHDDILWKDQWNEHLQQERRFHQGTAPKRYSRLGLIPSWVIVRWNFHPRAHWGFLYQYSGQ